MPPAPRAAWHRRSASLPWVASAVAVAVAAMIVVGVLLPVEAWLRGLLGAVAGLGPWAPPTFAALYLAATLLLLPGSVLTLGAGLAFGLGWGVALVSPIATLSACIAFRLGRTLARERVAAWVADRPRFVALDRAVAEQAFRVVLLVRLSPVLPFGLINYGFGLTRVGFWRYALASWLGMLPGTVMYVYLGTGLRHLAAGDGTRDASTVELVAFWGGLLTAVAVVVMITHRARTVLRRLGVPP